MNEDLGAELSIGPDKRLYAVFVLYFEGVDYLFVLFDRCLESARYR